jgi:hypothetical protein
MEVEKLRPVVVGRVSDKYCHTVGTSENMFTCFQIFITQPSEVEWVICQLTHVVVCETMKCINNNLEIESSCLRAKQAEGDGAL